MRPDGITLTTARNGGIGMMDVLRMRVATIDLRTKIVF